MGGGLSYAQGGIIGIDVRKRPEPARCVDSYFTTIVIDKNHCLCFELHVLGEWLNSFATVG